MLNTAIENVRWIADWGRQEHAVVPKTLRPHKISRVGVIGAGTMGTSIAAAHVQYRLPVIIHDVNADCLEKTPAKIAEELDRAGSRFAPRSFQRFVRPSVHLDDVAQCDLIIEAIAESLPAKMQLFQQLQKHLGPRTILASNTSTIPLQRLAAGLADPSRLCGLHFCHPVQHRPLVEIVYGSQTSDQTIGAVVAHARRINRMPMTVEDGPGFVVNRLLFPYLGEALELLREGTTAEAIEQAAIEFGMSIGPLRMMDEIGLDTTLHAAWVLAATFPDRILSSPILVAMVKAGRLGAKSQGGFLLQDDSSSNAHALDPQTQAIIAPWVENGRRLSTEDISHRLILPMLLEATRLLEEGKLRDAREIDLAALFGLGFPSEKGGLLWWADSLGARKIIDLLRSIDTTDGRFLPTKTLLEMAGETRQGRVGFYHQAAGLGKLEAFRHN